MDKSHTTIADLLEFKLNLENTVQTKELEKSLLSQELVGIAQIKEVSIQLSQSRETDLSLSNIYSLMDSQLILGYGKISSGRNYNHECGS